LIKALNIRVHGRVQGVNFRHFTTKAALKYNIKGYVKNEPDRTVFISAEGEEEAIDLFLLWCHDGPTWARVDKVDVQDIPSCGYTDFVIKY